MDVVHIILGSQIIQASIQTGGEYSGINTIHRVSIFISDFFLRSKNIIKYFFRYISLKIQHIQNGHEGKTIFSYMFLSLEVGCLVKFFEFSLKIKNNNILIQH